MTYLVMIAGHIDLVAAFVLAYINVKLGVLLYSGIFKIPERIQRKYVYYDTLKGSCYILMLVNLMLVWNIAAANLYLNSHFWVDMVAVLVSFAYLYKAKKIVKRLRNKITDRKR